MLRDEEIRERVKIPVDEGLGGCRGFESHRPHHRNDESYSLVKFRICLIVR